MRKSKKNSKQPEQIRISNPVPAKIEPLRPKAEQPDKLYNDLAKFPSENPYPVMRIHKDGTVLYANKASEPLLKAKDSRVGGPAPREWHQLVKKALSSGQVIREETEHDGRVFGFRAVPIVDSDYVNFYGADITERKRAEETLRETTQTLEAVIQASPLPIFAVDRELIVKTWNPAAERTFGWGAQEVIGRRYPAIPKEKMNEADALFSRAMESGLTEVETLRQRKDGSLMDVRISAAPLRDSRGNINGVMAVITDITEHKKAEERVKAEHQRLYDVLETLPVMVCLLTPDYHVAFTNRVFRQKFGEDNGRHCYDYIFGVKVPCEFCEAHNVLKTGKPHHWECTGPDGCSIIDVYDFPFTDTDGSPLILEMDIDITERKKAEQKLLDNQKQLKRLAAQLSLAEERERRRIAGELHDHVSQSLALAKIKIDSLHAALSSQPIAGVIEDISGSIEKAIQDTRTLTFDLSNPILYELGFEAAVSEWLNENVRDKHKINTEFQDDGQDKPLDDDMRALLFRNVRELLINTIKYSGADKIRVSIRRIDDSIEVVVEDNGVGFDPVEVRTLASKRAEFGLFSIRESLEQLGGHFEIESKPGAGCKATMTAPLKGKS